MIRAQYGVQCGGMDTCEVEGCDGPRYGRKTFCRPCYRRWRYNGEYPVLVNRRIPRFCSAEDCDEPLSNGTSGDLCREHWLRRDDVRVEEVVYRGITFRRYPDSSNGSHRNYFKPGGGMRAQGIDSLHREVYKDHHGPIPEGWHVHHADSDTSNNDPENLVALPPGEHMEHTYEGWRKRGGPWKDRSAMLAHLDSIRHLATAWHQSDEGREWHKKHAAETLHRG